VRVHVTSPGGSSLATASWDSLPRSVSNVPQRCHQPGNPREVSFPGGVVNVPTDVMVRVRGPRDKSRRVVVGDRFVEHPGVFCPASTSSARRPTRGHASRRGVMNVPTDVVVRVRIHVTNPGGPSLATASWNSLPRPVSYVPQQRLRPGDKCDASVQGEAS
jgi:hypothetical protein